MMASVNLNLTLPSSGWPDARNDDDEADDSSGDRHDGGGNQQHVEGITPVSAI
jgi:hypothetical protein